MKEYIVLYSQTRDSQVHWISDSALSEEKSIEEINAMSDDDIQTWIDEEQSMDDGWVNSDNAYVHFIVKADSPLEAKQKVSPYLFEQENMQAYELA